MTEIVDFTKTREHKDLTRFSQFLIELGYECDDMQPPHFCVLAANFSSIGGSLEYTSHELRDRDALLRYIGMLEAAKNDAFKKLDEMINLPEDLL